MMKKMSAALKNLNMKRQRAYGVAVLALVGGMLSTAVEGQDKYVPTRYHNIGLGELVSVYKGAYLRAGFKYRNETTEPHAMGGGKRTTLYFEFSIPKFPNNNGVVYIDFDVDSSVAEKKSRASCYVTKAWDLSSLKLHGAEYDLFLDKMEPADKRAISEIETKLIKFDTNRAERDQLRRLQQLPSPPGLH